MAFRVSNEHAARSTGATVDLVPGRGDSALALDVVRLDPGARTSLADAERDTLLFGFEGSGSLRIGGTALEFPANAAGLVLAGEDAALEAGVSGLAAIRSTVGSDVDRHAPLGSRAIVVELEDVPGDRAAGARSFEILLGPQNGSTRATLFVGHVPPGKAAWHYHLYDEIVWIPEGPGRLHVADAVEDLEAGSAFRLRPREAHIVENTSDDRTMTLLGVFTPAGSPSAAYLTADVAAEYRFGG